MTREDFDVVYSSHLKWLAGDEDGRRLWLIGEDLSDMNLSDMNLAGAIFYKCNFQFSRLFNTNLQSARFSTCNFAGADLRGANLQFVRADQHCSFFHLTPPEEGSYIGWKKARDGYIVKLRITEDALRSSATSRKCRCSEAIVLSIKRELDNGEVEQINQVSSLWRSEFVYTVGELVRVRNFDKNRWNECSTGIHHFLTKQEAINYH